MGTGIQDSLTAMAGDICGQLTCSLPDVMPFLNFITIYRDIPDGGTLSTIDSIQIASCTGSNLADAIQFDNIGVVNSLFAYIITDTIDVILYEPSPTFRALVGAGLERYKSLGHVIHRQHHGYGWRYAGFNDPFR